MKIKFLTCAIFSLCITLQSPAFSSTTETDKFDPESKAFSQMKTLTTWVGSEHQKDSTKMKEIQRNVAMEIWANLYSMNFLQPVQSDKDQQYFGKTFPLCEPIVLPFLQFVHSLKNPKIIEIGAARGFLTWLTAYALEGDGAIYANEISKTMMDGDFEIMLAERLKGTNLRERIKKLPFSCFEILEREKDLKNSCHAIIVPFVEHFFNPQQHQAFIKLLDDLLVVGGRAYLVSNTFTFRMDGSNPLYKLYRERKKEEDLYPGFAQYEVSFFQPLKSQEQKDVKVTNAIRTKDDTPTGTITLEKKEDFLLINHPFFGVSLIPGIRAKQRITNNAFSPTIYKILFEKAGFKVLDTKFLTLDLFGNHHLPNSIL